MNEQINKKNILNYIESLEEEKLLTLEEAEVMFLNHSKIVNRQSTTDYHEYILNHMIIFFHNKKVYKTNEITNKVIDKYVTKRLKDGVKNKTVNKEITSLKAMMNYLLKKELIDKIHFKYEKLPEKKTIIPRVKKDDVKDIIDYLLNDSKVTNQHKLIFLLQITTGIRRTELTHIMNANIDLENKRIYLDYTKSGTPRYIYIKDIIVPYLKKNMGRRIYLFHNKQGRRLKPDSVSSVYTRLKDRLHIAVLSSHKLRHYYAIDIYNKTLDIYLVSRLLGHAEIKTTEIYLDVVNKDDQKKNDDFNPINDFITDSKII